MQGHDGPKELLGKAEQFFLAIASVPRYTIRTKCMLTKANFPERAHELKTKVEDVAEAVKEVRPSKALMPHGAHTHMGLRHAPTASMHASHCGARSACVCDGVMGHRCAPRRRSSR